MVLTSNMNVALRNFALIRHDGAVTPCLRFADFEVGNLKEQSWDEIGNSKRYQEAVDGILNCEGCMNTWCTDWSMEENALPFRSRSPNGRMPRSRATKEWQRRLADDLSVLND